MTTPKTNKVSLITNEARAARLMETFLAEHPVPECLHEDLLEEIILALDCYADDDNLSVDAPVRQSELYQYLEGYLVRWVGDLIDSRLPTVSDMINNGFWPESYGSDLKEYGEDPSIMFHIQIYM